MLIRTFEIPDLDGVCRIERTAFPDDVYPCFFFRQAHDLWGELFRVAVLPSGEVIGYAVGATSVHEGRGWLVSMGVDAAHRGRGTGERLTESVVDALARAGMSEVRLTVEPGNEKAVRLYQRLGFEVIGEEGAYYGGGKPRLVMKRIV